MKYLILSLTLMLCSCTEYTYPHVKDGKLKLDNGRLPELVVAPTKVEAQQGTASAFEEVKGIDIPKESKWQDRVIGVGLAIGGLLIVIGIILSTYGHQPVKGIPLALGGVLVILTFTILYASMIWVQENTGKIVAGLTVVAIGSIVYYAYHNSGTIKSLIRGFEIQKDRLWSEEETKKIVKKAQGSFQSHINKLVK